MSQGIGRGREGMIIVRSEIRLRRPGDPLGKPQLVEDPIRGPENQNNGQDENLSYFQAFCTKEGQSESR